MSRSILKAWTVLAISGCTGLSAAATLTVPGTHATIDAALTAANAGDTIELTSNASAYTGNLYVTKDNITIQGQAALDPAPQIQGVSAAHPLVAAPAGTTSEKWYWNTGDATSRSTFFDAFGAAIVNDASGLTLRHLRISADPANAKAGAATAGVLDFRFGTGGTVVNCVLDGTGAAAIGAERLVLSENAHTFQNVTFQNGAIPLEHSAGTGTLQIIDCVMNGQMQTFWLNGGTAVVTGTSFDSSMVANGSVGTVIRNEYGPSDITFTRCTFRKSAGAGFNSGFAQVGHQDGGAARGADNYGTGRWSPATVEARFDQCDFIGNANVNRAISINSGRSSWVVKTLRVTRCNFYNIYGPTFNTQDFPLPGNEYKAGGAVDRYENFNVFKMAQNTASVGGIVSGGDSITLAGEPLYADVANGNFQLASNSPAATLMPSGTPVYTGALGVSAVSVPVNKITVGHSGANHTTINAAIAAATDGAVIEIIDNSAPYIEDILVDSRNGLTLQGASSLTPRPTVQATNASTYTVKLASAARNITLRNLVIDGTNLAMGEKMVLDVRDLGETVVENCDIIGGTGSSFAVFGQLNRIMRDCTVTQLSTGRALQHNLSGLWALINCNLVSAGRAIHLEGGGLFLTDSSVRADGDQTIQIGFTGRSSYLDIRDSIITSNATGTPASGNNLIIVNNVNGRRTVVIDNSDLVGSMQATGAGQSPTGSAIWVLGGGTPNYPLTYMNVTDTIFHNTAVHSIFFDGNTATNTIPGLTFNPLAGVENYNAFKWSPEGFASQGITQGANDLNLDGNSLYVNAPADFRILKTSPAATLNSTGTPVYAGSQGFVPGPTAATDWALFQ